LGDRSPFEEAAALIRLANWIFIGLLINADAVWATDPYGGAKFYFDDTHFHAGYFGDNRDDRPPIAAFLTALGNSKRKTDANSTSRDSELGGYFRFISDHLQYVPTRWNMTDEMYQRGKEPENDSRLEIANSSFTFTALYGLDRGLNAEGEGIHKIEIVRNKRCERDGNVIAMSEVRELADCSEVLAERHFDNSNFGGKYPRQFGDLLMVATPGDDLKYLFVLVTQSNGSRAITTPFYFY
jgi:hypothetical protein